MSAPTPSTGVASPTSRSGNDDREALAALMGLSTSPIPTVSIVSAYQCADAVWPRSVRRGVASFCLLSSSFRFLPFSPPRRPQPLRFPIRSNEDCVLVLVPANCSHLAPCLLNISVTLSCNAVYRESPELPPTTLFLLLFSSFFLLSFFFFLNFSKKQANLRMRILLPLLSHPHGVPSFVGIFALY